MRATNWLRGLCRLLPLPWAKSTTPRGFSGMFKKPSSLVSPLIDTWYVCLFQSGMVFIVASKVHSSNYAFLYLYQQVSLVVDSPGSFKNHVFRQRKVSDKN